MSWIFILLIFTIVAIGCAIFYLWRYNKLQRSIAILYEMIQKLTLKDLEVTVTKTTITDPTIRQIAVSFQAGVAAIRELIDEKTRKIHFQHELDKSASLQEMIDEIVSLSEVQREKIRMEREIETAKYVQETMFPPTQFNNTKFQVSIFSVSSSECSGDWWYYGDIAGHFFAMMGDATGHGVPAALICGAVRSAVSILETFKNITPSQILNYLNRCIYETSKGNMHMTFTVVSVDPAKNQLAIANASHEPIILSSVHNSKTEHLTTKNGPRLGESLDQTYEETYMTFMPGDMLVLYTDGIHEFKNEFSRSVSDRKFLQIVEKVWKRRAGESAVTVFETELNNENLKLKRLQSRSVDDVACLFLEMR